MSNQRLMWRWTVALVAVGCVAARGADLATAMAALDAGDDATARAVLTTQLAEDSFYRSLAEQGEIREQDARRAAELAPAGSWLQVAAGGVAAAAAGDLDTAIAALQKATGLSPNDFRLWKVLGDLNTRKRDFANARAAYERATTLNPSYPVGLIGLGDALRRDGDFGSAFNAYNHAINSQGLPVTALIGRATARLYMGDEAGASADLERAATVAPPGNDRYRALMGLVYLQTYQRKLPQGLDRAEEAARMWGQLGRADMVAATFNATGRVLLETGDPKSAETWYERGWQAIQVSNMPADQRTIWEIRWMHGVARCAATERDAERATSIAQQAAALMAKDTTNQEHYAWIGPYLDGYLALRDRRYGDAIAAFKKSDLTRPHLCLLLAEAYARNRNKTEARTWYQRALAASTGLDPESVLARPDATAWLAKNR